MGEGAWCHTRDYVEMQWLMLQQEQPEDYVIASGVQNSVRDFINTVGRELGMEITWQGLGLEESGTDHVGKVIVRVDPRYFRLTEVQTLPGAPSKAKEKLGWTPTIGYEELVAEMVREDLKSAERDKRLKKHGFAAYDHHE
ncbi:MAG: GDP-mannose 4,6-dehydratase [Proteobacteria bacterium]|nr:GDP-mannose 4,6-dehydratase [Pseudomonadota bacterium]